MLFLLVGFVPSALGPGQRCQRYCDSQAPSVLLAYPSFSLASVPVVPHAHTPLLPQTLASVL